jgi:hypothetical protein
MDEPNKIWGGFLSHRGRVDRYERTRNFANSWILRRGIDGPTKRHEEVGHESCHNLNFLSLLSYLAPQTQKQRYTYVKCVVPR